MSTSRTPQFLWAHKHDVPPIGRCIGLQLGDNNRALIGDVEFAKTEFANEIFELYRDGFLRAVSIGFRALVASAPSQEMLAMRPELAKCYRVITAGKLYEVSGVPIPSNPEALMKGLKLAPGLGPTATLGVRTEGELVQEVVDAAIAYLPTAIDEAIATVLVQRAVDHALTDAIEDALWKTFGRGL